MESKKETSWLDDWERLHRWDRISSITMLIFIVLGVCTAFLLYFFTPEKIYFTVTEQDAVKIPYSCDNDSYQTISSVQATIEKLFEENGKSGIVVKTAEGETLILEDVSPTISGQIYINHKRFAIDACLLYGAFIALAPAVPLMAFSPKCHV